MRRVAVAVIALAFAAPGAAAAQTDVDDESESELTATEADVDDELEPEDPAEVEEGSGDVRQPWWAADEAELMGLLERAGLAAEGTLEEAIRDLELPFAFAGREQWVRNLTGEGVADEPRLWDVSMTSIAADEDSFRLLLGRTMAAIEERGPQAATDDLGYWRSLVPAWAPRVRDALAERGIPFSVELLASPEIEIHDAAKPLFARGETPEALIGLGVLQRGENAFLRSLAAEELMLEVWPSYWRYHHRPAGAPVPEDLVAGLTFGMPVLQPCAGAPADGCVYGFRYRRSAVMETDVYKRWVAYGMPGSSGPGQYNGFILDSRTGYGFNPTTGAVERLVTGTSSAAWLALLATGAGVVWDPAVWFAGPNAPYAPDLLPPGTLVRFRALVAEG